MTGKKVFAAAATFFTLQLMGWIAWLNIFNVDAMTRHDVVEYAEIANYAIRVNAEIATFTLILSMSLLFGIIIQTFVVPWVKEKFIVVEDTDGSTDDAARKATAKP